MPRPLFVLFAALLLWGLLCPSAQAQTIRRVNNNPGILPVPGLVYTTYLDAENDAVDGDIILLEPSGTSYGTLDITKSVSIIGPGYLLNQQVSPPADLRSARADDIRTYPWVVGPIVIEGVTVNFACQLQGSNTTFRGCFFSYEIRIGAPSPGIQNIRFERCFLNGAAIINASYFVFSGNEAHNVTFSNCILTGNIANAEYSNPNTGWLYEYCIFLGQFTYAAPMAGAQFRNCVFYEISSSGYQLSGSFTVLNSVSNNADIPTGNGNIRSVTIDSMFVGCPLNCPSFNASFSAPSGYTYESQFTLSPNSPALTAGPGGTLIGLYGGTNPYKPGGRPTYPEIFQLNVAPAASSTVPLSVTIGVRSNN